MINSFVRFHHSFSNSCRLKMSRDGFEIVSLDVKDVRFPTSLQQDGSDAMHTDPDYSCAYVTIAIKNGTKGYGLTFTLGRGTEIVVEAVRTLSNLILHKNALEVFDNFSQTWRSLTSETQIRWIGPEKGVIHLATAAIINALWDLWARIENKPLWQLLCDLEPEKLVSAIDFRYITDVVTPEECISMLKESRKYRQQREKDLRANGYPAYTTQVGWLGYPTEKVEALCKEFLQKGFTAFKIKVGEDLKYDLRRCELIRRLIGPDKLLMVDANQRWDVNQSIEWMKNLTQFKPYWIEEPTSPDDVLGHATISKALNPLGIKVATGEMCANRVMFKQFLQANALQICQIDSVRIGGINEILSVYFMAKKLNVPVCPHAGGVGLCEMVQHLQVFDYICLTGTTEGRMIEYVEQQHEHFEDPTIVINAKYILPKRPGYSTKFKEEALESHEYPNGKAWHKLFASGLFKKPSNLSE